MPDVKNTAVLPKGETNGLHAIAGALADEGAHRQPKRLRAALVIIDPKRVAIDADTGDEIVTVRFRRIEVLLAADLPAAEKLLRRALEARSDETVLPLELEDEIRAAFEAMAEPDSPEDPDEGKGKGKGGGKQ
jgi:hypothetical protein